MPRAQLNDLALDALEDFKLDTASARASEKWLQASEGRGGLVIAAFALSAKGPQARLSNVPRAQRCVAVTFRALLD